MDNGLVECVNAALASQEGDAELEAVLMALSLISLKGTEEAYREILAPLSLSVLAKVVDHVDYHEIGDIGDRVYGYKFCAYSEVPYTNEMSERQWRAAVQDQGVKPTGEGNRLVAECALKDMASIKALCHVLTELLPKAGPDLATALEGLTEGVQPSLELIYKCHPDLRP